jgi:NADH dehydrogenase
MQHVTVLIVGATGQLGSETARQLVAAGCSVRALVRPTSNVAHLPEQVELSRGDLTDAISLEQACRGVQAVIATASALIPRAGETFARVEDLGYRHLIAACQRAAVEQFIYISVPVTPWDDQVTTFRTKRMIEQRLFDSRVPYTIFRSALFMDVYLAVLGSTLPFRGAPAASLRRPFWATRLAMLIIGRSIDLAGVAWVPGSGQSRHALIAIQDVASCMARAVGEPRAMNAVFDVGGPQALSWDQIVRVYARVLGRRVRAVHLPRRLLRRAQLLLASRSPAASNFLGVLWTVGGLDLAPTSEAAELFGVKPMTVEQFLRNKLRLPK